MNNFLSKYAKYIVLIVFGILTFIVMLQRPPFWDEANAWMIAKSFNIFELFKIEKYDGHLFLWHLIQMPFAKNDFFYPYSIYILNWLFCMMALIIFWCKAPFSNLEKTFITFSYPFFLYFAIVARCYSLGLIFLFLILSLWKKRIEHPLILSTLIIILANTSVMALFGAFIFALIFVYDLFKAKDKNVYLSFLILSLGAIIVLLQLVGNTSFSCDYHGFLVNLKFFYKDYTTHFLSIETLNRIIAVFASILYVVILFLNKCNQAKIFFVSVNILLISFFCFVYTGCWWHYLFFFIYAIVSIWLIRLKNPEFKSFFFLFLIILMSFKTILYKKDAYPYVFNTNHMKIAKIIKENNLIKENDNIYAIEPHPYNVVAIGIIPFFNNPLYDNYGILRYTTDGYKNNMTFKAPDYRQLKNSLDKNKRNIAIMSFAKNAFKSEIEKNIDLKLIFESKEPVFSIYEIKAKK